MAFAPSPYQAAIFAAIADPQGGNLIVEAVAGSGKTTTIVHAAELTTGAGGFFAFNKSIATELQARLPSNFTARTFHSLCYTPVTRALKARSVEANKLQQLIRANWTGELRQKYAAFATRLVGLARGVGIGCLQPDVEDAWFALVDQHDLKLDAEGADLLEGVNCARNLLAHSNASPLVDFDDLLYRAVRDGVRLPQFDWVFVDEAQDTNPIQRAILRKILKPGARLVAVGDPRQARDRLRDTASTAMDLIAREFECRTLPLSVSYRCAKAIVAHAQAYTPHIQHHDAAPEGTVTDLGFEWKLTDFGATDLVVCRNTKPLVALGYQLLCAKIPARILGRDIGEGLKALIKKCAVGENVDLLAQRLEAWRDRELEKLIAKDAGAAAQAVEDKAEALLTLCEQLHEDDRTVTALVKIIDELFTEENHRLTLATIHKAKGLEAGRVWWLNKSLCPSRWAKQPWQRAQETNLMYVAATRAKRELVLVEAPERSRK